MDEVPSSRVRTLHAGASTKGPVVYWCRTARRMDANPALQHAAHLAGYTGQGLWVWETVRSDRPHRCARFDAWIEAGMADNRDALAAKGIPYRTAWLDAAEEQVMLGRLGASVIVTDDHPMHPIQVPHGLQARVVVVDSNGLIPLAATPRTWPAAVHFRRFIAKNILDHLWWPGAWDADGAEPPVDDAGAPTEDGPAPVAMPGGARAGTTRLDRFVDRLDRYVDASHPDDDATSGLSPYLHYGHVGAHEVARRVFEAEDWHPGRMRETRGARGWWGVSDAAEAFLDQLVTWRELGFVDRHHRPDNHHYATQPEWAQATLAAHAGDPRETYTLAQLEAAETDDEVWNAAQTQLVRDGVIHNHLRMLWGKRILAWSATPEEAWDRCFLLNDRYALDGRDPNSISGIAWVFGRFDRAWQEREVYGKVRTMSSERTRAKLRMDDYLRSHAARGTVRH